MPIAVNTAESLGTSLLITNSDTQRTIAQTRYMTIPCAKVSRKFMEKYTRPVKRKTDPMIDMTIAPTANSVFFALEEG